MATRGSSEIGASSLPAVYPVTYGAARWLKITMVGLVTIVSVCGAIIFLAGADGASRTATHVAWVVVPLWIICVAGAAWAFRARIVLYQASIQRRNLFAVRTLALDDILGRRLAPSDGYPGRPVIVPKAGRVWLIDTMAYEDLGQEFWDWFLRLDKLR
jgi:hypothetical protein